MKRALIGALCGVAFASISADAGAFCRVTTCNPQTEACPLQDGCTAGGKPLSWASSCVTFSAQQAGSAKHGISSEELSTALEQAFARWLSVDCGGGAPPSIEIQDLGAVACDKVEYNTDDGNANIVVFRDEQWPHANSADAYAQTRVLFDPDSGEIKDAEIEINGTGDPISLDGSDGVDLGSVLTHEVGHFLGLDHSPDATATMRPGYQMGDDPLTTLSRDDIDGICAVYPPNRTAGTTSCEPKHGFSSECGDGIIETGGENGSDDRASAGCSVGRTHISGIDTMVLLAVGAVMRRRRREVHG